MEAPPIDSTYAFERIRHLSDRLSGVAIKHSVVCNDYAEPLAIHIPQALTGAEAAYHAQLAQVNTEIDPDPQLEHALYYLRMRHAVSPRTGEAYPPIVSTILKQTTPPVITVSGGIATIAWSNQARRAKDYLPQEIGYGDSVPHYDYMARGDMTYSDVNTGPNVHFTLQGEGAVRVGQVRHRAWIETMRQGVAEAKQNGMTAFEINNNLTTDFISRNNDPRVPEKLKRGVGYLDEAMAHATPLVPLKPGDAFIFQGHARESPLTGLHHLPVVHHFKTTSDVPRISSVFRASYESPGCPRVQWFEPLQIPWEPWVTLRSDT